MCLVARHNGLLRNDAVAAKLETRPARPVPDFLRAGLPARTGDLGTGPSRPGHTDGLSDELGGTPRLLHGELGEDTARKLIRGTAGLFALQHPHGVGQFFQTEVANQVAEQAKLTAR
jgi:hypothetical protein